jgi:hypothetical protein
MEPSHPLGLAVRYPLPGAGHPLADRSTADKVRVR